MYHLHPFTSFSLRNSLSKMSLQSHFGSFNPMFCALLVTLAVLFIFTCTLHTFWEIYCAIRFYITGKWVTLMTSNPCDAWSKIGTEVWSSTFKSQCSASITIYLKRLASRSEHFEQFRSRDSHLSQSRVSAVVMAHACRYYGTSQE